MHDQSVLRSHKDVAAQLVSTATQEGQELRQELVEAWRRYTRQVEAIAIREDEPFFMPIRTELARLGAEVAHDATCAQNALKASEDTSVKMLGDAIARSKGVTAPLPTK